MGWSNKMISNFLIKLTPLFSTLVLVFFLSINNQKEYTRLRILVWNTPQLTLGTYLAISTGSGFIISYLITTNLANIQKTKPKEPLKYKQEDKYEEPHEYTDKNINSSYENTFIERDIKDPSPTINASFRIIGRSERINKKPEINSNDLYRYDRFNKYEDQYDQKYEKSVNKNPKNSISSDWDDESFSSW